MRTTWVATATITLCLMLAGLSAAAASSPATSPRLVAPALVRYVDAVGDPLGGVGPDIVAVTVSQPDPESVSIAIEFATAPPLGYDVAAGWTDMLMIFIATGPAGIVRMPDGSVDVDYVTGAHGANLEETLATGAPLNARDDLRMGAVKVAVDDANLTLTLTRTSLGDPERILFALAVGREGGAEEASGGDAFPEFTETEPITHAAYWFATA